jgi:hypothetical protein
MSFLLHLFFYAVLAVVILGLLTWFTKNKGNENTPALGEWPEDKATHVNRVSAYSSSRRNLEDEQAKRRA